jgi:hypothetical protein
MADLALIDVVDSAVKIGLGGLIAGGFAYFISKSRQDHEMKKSKSCQDHEMKKIVLEQEVQVLKDIVEQIEIASDHLNDYSHLSRSISLPREAEQAKEFSELVMSGFKAMNRAKGLAYLIGQSELCSAFDKMCESLLEMYYLASEDIPTVVGIDEAHEKLAEARGKLEALNSNMKGLRLKVSESYSSISPS